MNEINQEEPDNNAESSDDEDIFTRLRTFIGKPEEKLKDNTEGSSKNYAVSKKKSKDPDAFDALLIEEQTKEVIANILQDDNKGSRKKHRIMVASDSEDESTQNNIIGGESDTFLEEENDRSEINRSFNRRIIEESDSDKENNTSMKEQNTDANKEHDLHSDDSSKVEKTDKSLSKRIIEDDSDSNDIVGTSENHSREEINILSSVDNNSKRIHESDSDSARNENKSKKKRILISDDED